MGSGMLVIRASQMAALSEASFRHGLQGHLRKVCPESTGHLTRRQMDQRFDHAVSVAAFYGFTGASGSVASLITLLFHMGPLFHRHPAVEAILLQMDALPEVRLARLFDLSAWTWLALRNPGDARWEEAIAQCPSR